ncbi:MAG: hypothetical protein GY697_21275 [Desulfobacterales bacterium]|nr:hypothetical protein [Desulfobacterales bacterium]
MQKRLVCVVGLLLLWAGCSFLSPAELSEMIPGMSKQMDKLECWLTIEFKKYPDGIDPRDVRVEFTSMALEQTEVFDWDYIAAHDVISLGFMKGFKENPASSPEGKPPLNVPLKVNYPLHAKQHLNVPAGETILLTAELYWGGKRVASSDRTIEHVYHPE